MEDVSEIQRKKKPEWSEVIDLLDKFYGPIVKAIEEDSILVEDWMPGLQRYLG